MVSGPGWRRGASPWSSWRVRRGPARSGAWSPGRRGACVEAAAGPDGHYARVSLRTRRRRKDVSAAQVSLMHGSRWPREDRVSLYLGDCRDDEPRWPRARGLGGAAQAHAGQPVPRAQVQVGAGLDVPGRGTGPVAQGRTSRGGPSEPCSRCRRGATWGGGTAPEKADDTCDRAHRFPTPGLPVLSRAGGAGRFLRRQPVATGSA